MRSSTFWKFLTSKFFFNFGEKHIKNVVSRKLEALEQPYLEAKLATPASTLLEPHHRDANIKLGEILYI